MYCLQYTEVLRYHSFALIIQKNTMIFHDFTNMTPLEFEPTLNGLLAQVGLCG